MVSMGSPLILFRMVVLPALSNPLMSNTHINKVDAFQVEKFSLPTALRYASLFHFVDSFSI
jgi:hypothetical protein